MFQNNANFFMSKFVFVLTIVSSVLVSWISHTAAAGTGGISSGSSETIVGREDKARNSKPRSDLQLTLDPLVLQEKISTQQVTECHQSLLKDVAEDAIRTVRQSASSHQTTESAIIDEALSSAFQALHQDHQSARSKVVNNQCVQNLFNKAAAKRDQRQSGRSGQTTTVPGHASLSAFSTTMFNNLHRQALLGDLGRVGRQDESQEVEQQPDQPAKVDTSCIYCPGDSREDLAANLSKCFLGTDMYCCGCLYYGGIQLGQALITISSQISNNDNSGSNLAGEGAQDTTAANTTQYK